MVYYGRNTNPSLGYRNWHPLEWLATDPAGLFRYLFQSGFLQAGPPDEARVTRKEIDAVTSCLSVYYST